MYSCLPDSPCLLHPISILTWKDGFICVCFIHLTSGCTPWLECVYALVHVYMSTWLPMSTQTNLHSNMERWVPLCGRIFVSHSPHYVASTCMECVHASVHVLMWTWVLNSAQSPMHSDMETWVSVCGTVYVAVISFLFPHLVLECVHALVHVFMPTWVLNYAALPMHNNMEHGCHSVADCVLQSSHFCTCISTWMYVHLTAHVGSSPFEQFHETWVALCVCHNQPISGHSPLLECVHASVHCIYVHLILYFIFIPLCKVTWKDVCPCVLLCDYSSKPTFSPTPWLACVHASVHVLLSTWLSISASPH